MDDLVEAFDDVVKELDRLASLRDTDTTRPRVVLAKNCRHYRDTARDHKPFYVEANLWICRDYLNSIKERMSGYRG